MNYSYLLFFTIISTLILTYLVSKYAFSNGKPHCKHFVTNVYLYLALSFSLVGCSIHMYNYFLNKKSDVSKLISLNQTLKQITPYIILSFIISIISIILLAVQPIFSKEGFMRNHIIWLLFILSISLSLYPYFKSIEYFEVLNKALVITSLIFLLMSYVAVQYSSFFNRTYKLAIIGMLVALVAIIITELCLLFTQKYTYNLFTIISYIVIILFSIFIAYDTSRLFHYADICVHSPNYPQLSSHLFLDILNIFVRLMGTSR